MWPELETGAPSAGPARSPGASAVLLDLTRTDPVACEVPHARASLDLAPSGGADPAPAALRAREAVAAYLADLGARVAPEAIFFASSPAAAATLVGQALGLPPIGAVTAGLGAAGAADPRAVGLSLRDDGASFDERALRRGAEGGARAAVIAHPLVPEGVPLSAAELARLDAACARHALALVADESWLGLSPRAPSALASARGALTVHLSGLAAIAGSELGCAWVAVAGPAAAVAAARAALATSAAAGERTAAPALAALPALLRDRRPFQEALRARLVRSWAGLAAAALREAPWSAPGGHAGPLTLLDLGAAVDDVRLCAAMREDHGVALWPGSALGGGHPGTVALSLVVPARTLSAGLELLEGKLRASRLG